MCWCLKYERLSVEGFCFYCCNDCGNCFFVVKGVFMECYLINGMVVGLLVFVVLIGIEVWFFSFDEVVIEGMVLSVMVSVDES